LVPGAKQALFSFIIQGESKLTIKVVQKVEPIFFIQVDDYLDVGPRPERMPFTSQLIPEFDIVEYLSVADQYDGLIFIENGLHTVVQPYDTEPAEPKGNIVENKRVLGIRPSMEKLAVHTLHDPGVVV
jgi:hypothetical protein